VADEDISDDDDASDTNDVAEESEEHVAGGVVYALRTIAYFFYIRQA
jgi:hypothetical protein